MSAAGTRALLMPIFPPSGFVGRAGWTLGPGKVQSGIYGAVYPPVTWTQAGEGKTLEWLHCLSYTRT